MQTAAADEVDEEEEETRNMNWFYDSWPKMALIGKLNFFFFASFCDRPSIDRLHVDRDRPYKQIR